MRQPPSIDAFGPGGFRVSGVWRPGSLLIVDDRPHDWAPTSLAEVTPESLQAALGARPAGTEFVLLGTGAVQALPPKALRDALRADGLGLEFMATDAAARTYNVLALDGRLFITALIAL